MKSWIAIFFVMLAFGVAWGLARDLMSKEQGVVEGVVTSVEIRTAFPKWLPGAPPHFKVRLPDNQVVDVATREPASTSVGSKIEITEWVTPWGEVWYTQRR